MTSVYDFAARSITGEEIALSRWRGQALLIVNVASQCGFTSQYEGLELLQKTYGPRGFAVLGFPCNQFGAQEPGSEAQIQNFCSSRFQVTFPMFAKVEVNGPGAHPLYQWLKAQSGGADIGWNFAKFLIDRNGALVSRHAPTDTPESLAPAIERLLG